MLAPLVPIGGLMVTQSVHAREERPVTWLTFPKPSKNRSQRIWKKLVRRSAQLGMDWSPLCFQTPTGFVMLPVLFAQLKQQTMPAGSG